MSQTPFIDWRSSGYLASKDFTMIVLRGRADFNIKVSIAKINHTSLGNQLQQQAKLQLGFSRSSEAHALAEKVYELCLPALERLAPQTSLQDLSLGGFLYSPQFDLELVCPDNSDEIRVEENECSYEPAFGMATMRTADLPDLCKSIPRFDARSIYIAPTISEGKSLSSVQGTVTTEDGTLMYFKPRQDLRPSDFERELCILSRIREAGLNTRLRVPELLGIVVSGSGSGSDEEEEEVTMGMLMTLITSPEMGKHLQSPGFHDKVELHQKWEKQVTDIVQELHANDIVWGDVNPMNVVIDEAMDAWVIDFGGNNNIEFVDEENCETVEGDWQGIKRLFQEWLPGRSKKLQEKDYLGSSTGMG